MIDVQTPTFLQGASRRPAPVHAPTPARMLAIALLACGSVTIGAGCYEEPPEGTTDGTTDAASGGMTEGMTEGATNAMTDATAGPTGGSTPGDDDPDDGDPTMTSGNPDDSADGDTEPATDTTTATGPDPDTGATGCDGGGTCVEIPAGWNGPIAAIDALGNAPSPACDGTFGVASFEAFEGLTAPDADCGCDCVEPAGVSCPATSSLNRYDNNVLNCLAQTPDNVHPIAEGCNDIPFYDDDSFRLIVPALDLAATPCMPQASTTVPPVAWATQVAGCELGDPPAACDGGTCVPPLDDPSHRLCVWSEGDVECSGDVFTERQVLHREVDDSRGCSACGCEPAEGSCGATFTLRAGESCTVASPGSGPAGVCVPIDTPARSVELAYDAPEISCPPTGGDAEGTATPADPITVCCAAG